MIKTLRNFVVNKDKIYCYGMGVWARRIGKYCKRHNVKLDAYIATENNNTMFLSKPSYKLSDVYINEKDGIIIATQKREYIDEILTGLKKN